MANNRIAEPDFSSESQIHSTGLSLINLFAQDLFAFIDKGLAKEKGKNWLTDLQLIKMNVSEVNYNDPSVLLKEVVNVGSSPLRAPISALVPKAQWKDFYNRLAEVLGSRHLWFHNEIRATSEELKSLCILIRKVSWILELQVSEECGQLLAKLEPEDVQEAEDELPSGSPSEIVGTFQPLTENESLEVGTQLSGPFISHSYTLHLNGSIRDRATDDLLQDICEAGGTLGALLIARKPSGGRLRITEDGQIAAYFGEHWGYLGVVSGDKWFPGHLSS
ncbi:hypothetical protein MCEMRE217_00474 [Candidatus Nanopelagicaceae bacterium]